MEKIDFVLFFCLFPLSLSFGKYFSEKMRIQRNEEIDEKFEIFYGLIMLFVWVSISILLYNN